MMYTDAQTQSRIYNLEASVSEKQATIERLEAERDVEQLTAYRMSERVTELAAQVAALREALEMVQRDLLYDVTGSRKGSIGSLHNTYICQLSVRRIDKIGVALAAALGDPSPQADAVREVIEAALAWSSEAVSLNDGEELLDNALDAYRAVTRGDGGVK